jgi:hypothetical protein
MSTGKLPGMKPGSSLRQPAKFPDDHTGHSVQFYPRAFPSVGLFAATA